MDISLIKASLKKQANYINIVDPKNKVGLWLNAIKCCFLYGATPSDWFFYEMYKYNHRENKEIITNRKSNELDRLFNPREFAKDFDDKVIFNTKYKDFVKRDWIYLKECSEKDAVAFVEQHKEVVVKPIGLSSGKGIYLFKLTEHDIKEITSVCGSDYMLEEKIEEVDELKCLNPSSCQTLRIITMVKKDGDVDVLATAIRVGGGKTIVDNFHSNGAAYPIDKYEGVISGMGKNLLNKYFLRHPSTNMLMPGYQIPNWRGVMEFAKKAALQNPRARFIGWDIAITPDGFEMVEGNYLVNCNFIQTFDKKGKYSYIKSFL